MRQPVGIYSTDRGSGLCVDTVTDMLEREPGLEASDITVYVSGSSSRYLEGLKARGVTVVDRDPNADATSSGPVQCATRNFLRVIAGADPERPLYLCEDDIRVADQWMSRAEALSQKLPAQGPLALALFFPYVSTTATGWAEYAGGKFWGNQCVRLSAQLVSHAQEFFAGADPDSPPDMALKKMFLSPPFPPLYGCQPSLAQHVGVTTTVTGRDSDPARFAANLQTSHFDDPR